MAYVVALAERVKPDVLFLAECSPDIAELSRSRSGKITPALETKFTEHTFTIRAVRMNFTGTISTKHSSDHRFSGNTSQNFPSCMMFWDSTCEKETTVSPIITQSFLNLRRNKYANDFQRLMVGY